MTGRLHPGRQLHAASLSVSLSLSLLVGVFICAHTPMCPHRHRVPTPPSNPSLFSRADRELNCQLSTHNSAGYLNVAINVNDIYTSDFCSGSISDPPHTRMPATTSGQRHLTPRRPRTADTRACSPTNYTVSVRCRDAHDTLVLTLPSAAALHAGAPSRPSTLRQSHTRSTFVPPSGPRVRNRHTHPPAQSTSLQHLSTGRAARAV